jgi:hypothetical protein
MIRCKNGLKFVRQPLSSNNNIIMTYNYHCSRVSSRLLHGRESLINAIKSTKKSKKVGHVGNSNGASPVIGEPYVSIFDPPFL